ncbi:MAG TPA: hypothetical protein DEF82_05660 [Crocinitomicaceae bacterium]|nr:hypothetical protein [Crocinitomicaceae bacterium]
MESKAKRGKLKVLVAFLLVFGPAATLIFISTRGCQHSFQKLEDFGQLPNHTFSVYIPEKDSFESKKLHDFHGDIVFISTIQTSCPSKCQLSLFNFRELIYNHIFENKRKKLKQVRIISFLTDGNGNPITDTAAFKTMSEILKDNIPNYDPSLWTLAMGDVKSFYNIESNGKNLLKSSEQEYGVGAYQKYLLLLDKESHLRMVLPANKEGEIRVMFEHLALLQKEYDKNRSE